MKKTLVIAAAAMLTVSLAACGMDGGTADYGTDLHHGTERSGMRYAAQDESAARSRYRLMLDNARVRDTDGFLLDGENARHDTLF